MSGMNAPQLKIPSIEDLEVGQSIGEKIVTVTRSDLIAYAGASGDHNPIHWNNDFAESVGLPGVIAHGMFTMGSASALVIEWVQDPGRIRSYSTRFSKPVPVKDTILKNATVPNITGSEVPGAVLNIAGKIGAIKPQEQTARVDLTVTHEGGKVLMKTQAVVDLSV